MMRILLFVALLLANGFCFSQQDPQFSQYLFKNPIMIMLTIQLFELLGFCLFYLSIKKKKGSMK